MKILDLDYKKIDSLKTTLNDNHYVEYIWHRFFEDKTIAFDEWSPAGWTYPEDWLSRYHLYFEQYKHLINSASILDIGAGLNFYGTWASLNGCDYVDYIEPDKYKFKYGKEYIKVREQEDYMTGWCMDINTFMEHTSKHHTYDVVFLLDVLYYTNNHMEIFMFLKHQIKAKYVFFECTVLDDIDELPNGHSDIWFPDTNPAAMQGYPGTVLAMRPTRKALFNIIGTAGFNIDAMYDYKDYKGSGESPPRGSGQKVFMVLSQR